MDKESIAFPITIIKQILSFPIGVFLGSALILIHGVMLAISPVPDT